MKDRIELTGDAARRVRAIGSLTGLSHDEVVLKALDFAGTERRHSEPRPEPDRAEPWRQGVSPDSQLWSVCTAFGECLQRASLVLEEADLELRWRPRTSSGLWVSEPNAVAVKPQTRKLDLRLSVLGAASDFPNRAKEALGLKDSRPGYCTLKFSGHHKDVLTEVLEIAFRNRLRRLGR